MRNEHNRLYSGSAGRAGRNLEKGTLQNKESGTVINGECMAISSERDTIEPAALARFNNRKAGSREKGTLQASGSGNASNGESRQAGS